MVLLIGLPKVFEWNVSCNVLKFEKSLKKKRRFLKTLNKRSIITKKKKKGLSVFLVFHKLLEAKEVQLLVIVVLVLVNLGSLEE